jgi:hypothetical protein
VGVFSGPDVSESGLVLALDGANLKSFKGEATTNLARNSRDFSGTAYASSDEWVSSEPTRLTKTYISSLPTPIGNGATLIQESGTAGFHHLSRYGGGDEDGLHSLSCYVYPLTNDITDFCIGMLNDGINNIRFNLNTRAITYGDGISNRNAFITPVIGYDGWYRVGANIEGRSGGWVGCFGYSSYTSYTGISGAKRCYITGIQYESKSSPTSFVEAQTTRGTTVATGGGWEDLTGNGNNGELVNGVRESADNLGSLSFDGTNDEVKLPGTNLSLNQMTISSWNFSSNYAQNGFMFEKTTNGNVNTQYSLFYNSGNNSIYYRTYGLSTTDLVVNSTTAGVVNNQWNNVVATFDGTNKRIYVNGILRATSANLTGTVTQNSTGIALIGRHGNTSAYPFNGRIAQTQIYNRALTAAEIQQNYIATKSRYGL